MKIEIKKRVTEEVIFSHECDNNTIKKTVETAASLGVSLRDANLCGANLRGANLYDANLRGANLCGANLFGEKLKKPPVLIENLNWSVTITDVHMKIGCQLHTIEDWRSFSDDEIDRMSPQALVFWKKHNVALLALCDAHGADE